MGSNLESEVRRGLVEIALKVVAYDFEEINLEPRERDLITQYPGFFNVQDLKGSAVRVLRDALLREGAFAEGKQVEGREILPATRDGA